MMNTQFSVFEVLQIAEEIEHRAARFCLRAAERCPDRQRRQLYYHLTRWRSKHEQAWIRIRHEYSEKTGQFGTFDPDDYLLSNPQVMAGLTMFGSGRHPSGRHTGRESREDILADAIRRSRGVVVFYHGLKEFAGDPESRMMIDAMIGEEGRHTRLLSGLLDRPRTPSAVAGVPI